MRPRHELRSIFNTADLFEDKNMGSVLVTLDALRRGVRGRTEVAARPHDA